MAIEKKVCTWLRLGLFCFISSFHSFFHSIFHSIWLLTPRCLWYKTGKSVFLSCVKNQVANNCLVQPGPGRLGQRNNNNGYWNKRTLVQLQQRTSHFCEKLIFTLQAWLSINTNLWENKKTASSTKQRCQLLWEKGCAGWYNLNK